MPEPINDLITVWKPRKFYRKSTGSSVTKIVKGPFKTVVHVNRAMDKLHREIAKEFPKDDYYLDSYKPVKLVHKSKGYCWHCKKVQRVNDIYGGFEPAVCPVCGHTLAGGGAKHENCGGAFWLKSSEHRGPECVYLTYQCDKCGVQDFDVID